MKAKGSNFHPARISGIQKLIREREANKPKPVKKSTLIPAEEFFKSKT